MSIAVPLYGFGTGGTTLNFKVIGGTEAPANPTENTIWINTDTPITSWAFSTTEPETPAEGMLWISTGAASAVGFDALKKNTIRVYPLSAKQYIAGVWTDKTTQIYQGSAWKQMIEDMVIYAGGNKFVALKYTPASNVTEGSDYLTVKATSSVNLTKIDTSEPIDLTGYSRAELKYSNMTSGATIGFRIQDNGEDVVTTNSTATSGTLSLDLTTVIGLMTVHARFYYVGAASVRITSIKLYV